MLERWPAWHLRRGSGSSRLFFFLPIMSWVLRFACSCLACLLPLMWIARCFVPLLFCVVAVLGLAVAVAPVAPMPSIASTPSSDTAGPKCRDRLAWPFASTSIWNTPLGSDATLRPAHLFDTVLGTALCDLIAIPATSSHNDAGLGPPDASVHDMKLPRHYGQQLWTRPFRQRSRGRGGGSHMRQLPIHPHGAWLRRFA